jgi:hypothetical protein
VDIEEAAAEFTRELEALINNLLTFPVVLVAEWQQFRGVWRATISTADVAGLPLSINDRPTFQLQFKYQCEFHAARKRLTVRSSSFKVMHAITRLPLWHYDYVREMKKADSAIAHLNVHAHRNEIAAAMAIANPDSGNLDVQALHFPFGGPRFRPILEDVFEMLISEFNVDTAPDAIRVLKKSRKRYFERQVESAVFDQPDAAASTLRQLGYSVEPPSLL